jgi:integrating conjugative element protein (TIGR03757 family)
MKWQTSILLMMAVGSAVAESGREQFLPHRIDLITDSTHAFVGIQSIPSNVTVTVFDLDQPARLEAELSEGLPNDIDAAAQIARQRLQTIDRQPLRARFTEAFAGFLISLQYGIDRYPAIVFDGGESVVYGITDIKQALKHYQRWRDQQESER